jgi:spoIIIJ-associated protein
MEYVEAEGTSIDDAIERALAKLGATRDRVDVEILGNASKGLFGLGGKKAKVRATLRTPIDLHDGSAVTTADRAAARPPRQARSERPERPGRSERPPRRTARAAPGNEGQRAPSVGNDGQRAPSPGSDGQRAPSPGSDGQRAPSPRREKRVEDRPSVEIDDATLEHARTTLEHAVRLIGTEAQVRVVRDDLGTSLMIEGDESGILIGRRGQTLDALEYMINRIASRDTRNTTHLVVDSQGYRQRRREALEALAQRMGERAAQRGKPVTMNPMSPRDRRIVHLALEAAPGLETRSAGEGYFRKLLIIPRR